MHIPNLILNIVNAIAIGRLWEIKGMIYIIAMMKNKKLVHFNNSMDCYNNLSRIINWRQIEAGTIKEAFIKYNQI